MKREIYATDGYFVLYRLAEEDKANYMRLEKEDETSLDSFANPKISELLWQISMSGADWEFTIYDQDGEFYGIVMLKRPNSENPEIGFRLLKAKRNKSYGGKIIKLLAQKAYKERKTEYYLLRVKSDNLQSLRMIEKLGAEPVGTDHMFRIYIQNIKKSIEKETDESLKKKLEECLLQMEKSTDCVYEYKLTPKVFLKT